MAYPRGHFMVIAAASFAAACTSEELVTVEPSFVDVAPPDASAIEGDQIQLVGTVHDAENNPVSGQILRWSSSDTSVATVNATGLVTTRSPGEVEIRARFEDVVGEATVEVLRGPFVVVVPSSLTLYMAPTVGPPQQVLAVSNGGAGSLEQLSAGVTDYEGDVQGWLAPTLAGAVAPTSLTLVVDPARLGGGRHRATVSVTSRARGDPADVDVVVNVAGFQVRHTGPATTVTEGGSTDQIAVVLESQPSDPVVLLVTASDPTEAVVSPPSLRFTRGNWDREQMITVRGADDIDDDANQVSTVTIGVDDTQSPDAFEALPARTLSVTTVDNDEPPGFVIVESAGSTVVTEANATDDFTVRLAAPIAANVVLEVVTTNGFEVGVLSSAFLTFTPATWNVPQTVTVIGINDFFFDGNRLIPVVVRVLDVYSDARYHGLSTSVVVTNVDDELGG